MHCLSLHLHIGELDSVLKKVLYYYENSEATIESISGQTITTTQQTTILKISYHKTTVDVVIDLPCYDVHRRRPLRT